MHPRIYIPLFALLLIASTHTLSAKDGNRLERWRSEIQEIDLKLRKGTERNAKRAGKAAEKLWVEVRRRGWHEPTLNEILGELTAQMAIAQLNQNLDQDRAVWLFHSALLLDRSVAERDWGAYGRAGRILAEVEPRILRTSPPGMRAVEPPFPVGRFKRPAIAKANKPVEVPMNRAARLERRLERPTIEVVVRRDGSVSHPVIANGHTAKPTVILATLDMIWAMAPYSPALLDGEPVDVVFDISTNAFQSNRWDRMVEYF